MGDKHDRKIQQSFTRFFILLALGSALLPTVSFARTEPVPPWVTEAAHQTLPNYPAETNAVVLLDETTYSVAANGTAIEHRRRVLKILRPGGREEAVVAVPFDKDTQIRSLKVWSIGPDGHEYTLKPEEIVDYGYPGQGSLFQDDKLRIAKAPGRDPGGVVAYEYEQTVRPYLTEKTWNFQESIPKLHQSFILELPPGFTYGTVWAHHLQSTAIDLEHQHFRWDLKDTPGIDLEHIPMAPAEYALAGRMTIHYAGPGLTAPTTDSWRTIGEWYQQLSRDRLTPTPEIAAKAKELTAGKTDFYDKTEAIGEFVQRQIRYFVIEVGIGGYQPHPAADIFRNRYGDCKDKATLVSAMLSSVGIHSALMMVDTARGVVDPEAPSLMGNHMIAAIEIPEAYNSPSLRSVVTAKNGHRYLIFDPTWEMTPFGQLEHNLQGGYGVLLEGPDTQAIQLPILAPERNTVRRNATFELTPEGTLQGTVTEKRFGDVSERRRTVYTTGDAQEQSRYLDHALTQDLAAFSVSDVKVADAMSLNKDFTLTYALSADHFARRMGSLLMVRPRVLGSDAFPLDRKPRHIPIDLRETMQNVDAYDIKLPPGYTIDELPEPVKLDVGFASYESRSTLQGDTLHYTRTYTVRQVTLPPDLYPDLQRLDGVIEADEQNSAVLTRK
ncbi:DUF3857 domain-containing transglutaminase family protein [Granulicella sibirica]|uniref:DUF3857 domain-containing transglutaminase family protein n=1 Tax=Granulicella sibirica TaxID=2479048 RepID=UPI001008A8FE|nr:DUF3857 domain-containing protein [Granulicella sibirica]